MYIKDAPFMSIRIMAFFYSKKYPHQVPHWFRQRELEVGKLVSNGDWYK